MDKITKLSDAMELGATYIKEVTQNYIKREVKSNGEVQLCGCALGTAALVLNPDAKNGYDDSIINLAKRLNLPTIVLFNVSYNHFSGRKTRAQIIVDLRARGL